MKYIIGKKLNMTQHFDDKGIVTPVTVVAVESNTVTRVKTHHNDGYAAVQIGYGTQKPQRVPQVVRGTVGGAAYSTIAEFRLPEDPTVVTGEVVAIDTFVPGDSVSVTSTSKAKGFQGVVKRHGFHGGPRSHGQKHSEREPGSIGGGPGRAGGRVTKGMRMAGRTGGNTVTVKGLHVVSVDAAAGLLYISGAIPGRRGTLVRIVSMS